MGDAALEGLIRCVPHGGVASMTQTSFVPDRDAPPMEQGNCWATAVASLFGLTEEQRDEIHLASATEEWWDSTNEWLEGHGYDPLGWTTDLPEGGLSGVMIASGRSPRGDFRHSVLWDCERGVMLSDPHPSGAGLVGEPEDYVGVWTRRGEASDDE